MKKCNTVETTERLKEQRKEGKKGKEGSKEGSKEGRHKIRQGMNENIIKLPAQPTDLHSSVLLTSSQNPSPVQAAEHDERPAPGSRELSPCSL